MTASFQSANEQQLLYSLSMRLHSHRGSFRAGPRTTRSGRYGCLALPRFAADITDPRSRSVKVRHVASMAAGHTREMLAEAIMRDREEPVRGWLLIPPDRDPGTVFTYSQPCTYTLASIIQRNRECPSPATCGPGHPDPLGIGHVGWHTLPPGREQGFSGLHARTEDIAKLGLLYIQGGRWEGAQLIPGKWVAEATSEQISNPGEPNPDWRQGYGYQFWMSRHGYRGDGAFGQFCVILPEQDAVIVTTACTLDMQAVLDAMWAHPLPGLGTVAPGAGTAHDQLSSRLARLDLAASALPADSGAPAPCRLGPVDQRAVYHRRQHRRHPGSALPDLRRGGAAGRRLADQPHRACQRADLSRWHRSLDRL